MTSEQTTETKATPRITTSDQLLYKLVVRTYDIDDETREVYFTHQIEVFVVAATADEAVRKVRTQGINSLPYVVQNDLKFPGFKIHSATPISKVDIL